MRQPPSRLDIKDAKRNPDVFNVSIFLDDVRQAGVLRYDRDEGWLERNVYVNDKPLIKGDEFAVERIQFSPESLRVEWIDEERAERDGRIFGLE